jgi:multiple antibiotic resistance protein
MITAGFVFTIFMLTLGPIKTVPAFYAMTQDLAASERRSLAIKGTLVATAIALLIALVMRGTAASWGVSVDDLRLAGGLLLFAASRDMISQVNRPSPPPPAGKHPAVTPLAIPVIITPWGVVAILLFMDLANGNFDVIASILGMLLLIMALNLVGMLLARQIIGLVGLVTFQVMGWIFAVLQAGLAVEAVVISLQNFGLIRLVH